MYRRTLGVCAVGFLMLSSSALAASVTFTPTRSITNNDKDGGDMAIGLRQIHMTLSEVAGSTPHATYVDFTFENYAPTGYTFQRSSITDIWFDDVTFNTDPIFAPVENIYIPLNPEIKPSPGVEFTRKSTMDSPPGSQTVKPSFGVTFSSSSTSPDYWNGVNKPGEWVTFRWLLADNRTFQEAVHAVSNGDLRIAVKMQGYADGGSETFIFVPAPASAVGGFGLLAFAGLSTLGGRRKAKSLLPPAC
jgi:hypothetical protein